MIQTPSFFYYSSLFVTRAEEIYFSYKSEAGLVDKQLLDDTGQQAVARFADNCCGLFNAR